MVNKTELTAVENKIPDVTNLVNKTELRNVKDKIPDTNGFVKKTDYATETTKIKNDYVTATGLDARHKDLAQKTTFNAEIKKIDDKVIKNSSEILSYESRLKQKEDVTNDLERDSCYVRGKNYFGEDGRQNYLVFQLTYEYLKRVVVTANNVSTIYIHYWQSKGLSTN